MNSETHLLGFYPYYLTCGDGWVQWNFKGVVGLSSLTDSSTVTVLGAIDGRPVTQGFADPICTFDVDCVVTPEPMTLALLSRGLMGLCGVGLLRRRPHHLLPQLRTLGRLV